MSYPALLSIEREVAGITNFDVVISDFTSVLNPMYTVFSSFSRTACELGVRVFNFVDYPTQPINMLICRAM